MPVERPDFPRLTLTLPVLSASKVALFLVTGSEKREALRALLDHRSTRSSKLLRAGE